MTTYKQYFSKEECHTGTIEVFSDPDTKVPYFGGGTTRDLVIYEGHLIVAMTSVDVETVKLYNFEAPRLIRNNNPVVRISWPDYDIPALERDFWLDLIDVINEEWLKKRITGVTCCCVGGHGRTGTALAILAGLTGACISDPVLFVREHYCKKVVESESQIKYIEEMTGIPINVKANKSYGYQGSFFDDDEHDYYGYRGIDYYDQHKKNRKGIDYPLYYG